MWGRGRIDHAGLAAASRRPSRPSGTGSWKPERATARSTTPAGRSASCSATQTVSKARCCSESRDCPVQEGRPGPGSWRHYVVAVFGRVVLLARVLDPLSRRSCLDCGHPAGTIRLAGRAAPRGSAPSRWSSRSPPGIEILISRMGLGAAARLSGCHLCVHDDLDAILACGPGVRDRHQFRLASDRAARSRQSTRLRGYGAVAGRAAPDRPLPRSATCRTGQR